MGLAPARLAAPVGAQEAPPLHSALPHAAVPRASSSNGPVERAACRLLRGNILRLRQLEILKLKNILINLNFYITSCIN